MFYLPQVAPQHINPWNNATITAAADSQSLYNDLNQGLVSVLINIANAPTGTTPTLTVSIMVSKDGTTWFSVASTSALNAAGQTRLAAQGIVEPYVKVHVAVGGTTPSFTGVSIDAYLA